MTKYIVEVRIPITQFQNVTVDAENKNDAVTKAIELAEQGLSGDWIDDPDSAGDFYIGDVMRQTVDF
jgi:hypothetical protein